MTLVAVPPFTWGMQDTQLVSGGFQVMLIDANDKRAAGVFQAPKTGNIDRVCFRTGTVTTGDTVTVSLQTLDSTGNPSGTLWGTNTSNTKSILATDDNVWFEITLTAAAAVTRGDMLALVVAMPVTGAVGSMNVNRISPSTTAFPATDLYSGAAWTKGQTVMVGAVRYDDTTYPPTPGLLPYSTINNTTFNSGSTPDERGNKITAPFACKVAGIWSRQTGSTTGDFELRLYNSSSTLLASKAVDADFVLSTNAFIVMLNAEVTVAAGDVLRITKLPTSATNSSYTDYTCASGLASAMPLGTSVVHTERTDAGAWTDTSNKQAAMGLIVSALDDGSGGAAVQRSYSFAT